jgi:membrane associated rhomboid family serine protease
MKITAFNFYTSASAVLFGWIVAAFIKGSFSQTDFGGIIAMCILIFVVSIHMEKDKE